MRKEELEELGTSGWTKLNAAIQKGDKSEALRLANELKHKSKQLFDSDLDWMDLLLQVLAKELGEESVYQVTKTFHERSLKHLRRGLLEGPRAGAEERLRALADVLTLSHGIDIGIEEDQEKFIIKMPCDTGGKIITRGQHGKTMKAYPWSNMQKDFCYYCVHCVVSWEIMPIEEHGCPAWVISAPKEPGEPCTLFLYKDPRAVPEQYYTLVGMEKK